MRLEAKVIIFTTHYFPLYPTLLLPILLRLFTPLCQDGENVYISSHQMPFSVRMVVD